MKRIVILSLLLTLFTTGYSQKYISKNGMIKFYSQGAIEKIEAINRQVNCALDATTGDLVFKVLIRSFEFEKALMQEHFNENYMESDKYPNASFVGKVTNIKEMDFSKETSYTANIEGKLTIHGVTNEIKEKGTLQLKGGKLNGDAKFNIKITDYGITIPKAVVKNIAESVEVTISVKLDKFAQ